MSRFFKSAAFPILIVVVLAFFAQKLIGSSHSGPKQTYGDLLYQLDHGQVQSLSLHLKDNTANVTTTKGLIDRASAAGYKYMMLADTKLSYDGDPDLRNAGELHSITAESLNAASETTAEGETLPS